MDIRYLAGYFDGEGTIVIQKGVNTRRRKEYTHYQLRVAVSNTYCTVLFELKRRFGGRIGTNKPNPLQTKPSNYWVATGDEARNFLKEISPYLVEKGPQAELALKLPYERTHPGNSRTLEEKELQESIYQEVKRLKHVGGACAS